jgi:polyhydroxybutyrate depolymerase
MNRNPQAAWLFALLPVALFACTAETPAEPNAPAPSSAGGSSAGAAVIPSSGSGSLPVAGSPAAGGAISGGGAAPSAGTSAGGAAPVGGAASGGSGGASGGASTGSGGSGHATGMTTGCGKAFMDEPNKDILHNITVAGVARRYWTRTPTEYAMSTPMPLVFYGPGCGASGVEGAPLDDSIRHVAIRVFVIGTGGCFDTDGPEPETSYFGAVLDEVQANYCTDKGKVFVSGYSSGAWLSDLLACTQGDRITAIGTAAGGLKAAHPACKGNPAAMFHAGTNDGANPIVKMVDGMNEGSSAARDRMLAANHCTMETKVWDPMYPYCKEYVGCSTPVVWCQQDGVGHSNGEEVARTGWWKFWSSLP